MIIRAKEEENVSKKIADIFAGTMRFLRANAFFVYSENHKCDKM